MSRVAGPRAAQTLLFRLGSSLASCADAVKVGRRSARAAGSTSPGHALRVAVRDATLNATGIVRKLNLDAPPTKQDCHRKLSAVAVLIGGRLFAIRLESLLIWQVETFAGGNGSGMSRPYARPQDERAAGGEQQDHAPVPPVVSVAESSHGDVFHDEQNGDRARRFRGLFGRGARVDLATHRANMSVAPE